MSDWLFVIGASIIGLNVLLILLVIVGVAVSGGSASFAAFPLVGPCLVSLGVLSGGRSWWPIPVAWLCDPETSAITGSVLRADGGFTA